MRNFLLAFFASVIAVVPLSKAADCNDNTPCWDLSPRDAACNCPSEPPECLIASCWDGIPPLASAGKVKCSCTQQKQECRKELCFADFQRSDVNCLCENQCYPASCPDQSNPQGPLCRCEGVKCGGEKCWDGSKPEGPDCVCPSCEAEKCWNGEPRDSDDCSCPLCSAEEDQICWDGSERTSLCECPSCGGTCWNGDEPDPQNNCECPLCPDDLCWDGSSRSMKNGCDCPYCPDSSVCGWGLARNEQTCECYFCEVDTCWDGSKPELIGCTCPECPVCWDGKSADENCGCTQCEEKVCWDGNLPLQANSCECASCADSEPCWDGSLRIDQDCTCPDEPIKCSESPCPGGEPRNPDDCSCESDHACRAFSSCRDGYSFNDDSCQCEASNQKSLDGSDISLEPVYCTKKCPAGMYLNRKFCRCENRKSCYITQCAPGYFVDYLDCKCVSIASKQIRNGRRRHN